MLELIAEEYMRKAMMTRVGTDKEYFSYFIVSNDIKTGESIFHCVGAHNELTTDTFASIGPFILSFKNAFQIRGCYPPSLGSVLAS